jgi:multidrug resistance efflux pump
MTIDPEALRARLTTLEARLAQQTQRRDSARAAWQTGRVAVHQLEGAILVLRELLAPFDEAAAGAPLNGAGGEEP